MTAKQKPRGNPSKAGKASAQALTESQREIRASNAGKANLEKYSSEYYSALGKHAMAIRWGKK